MCKLLGPVRVRRSKYPLLLLTSPTHSWLTLMNKSGVSCVVFIDLKKAFDLVDHDILLKKLTINFVLKTHVLYH